MEQLLTWTQLCDISAYLLTNLQRSYFVFLSLLPHSLLCSFLPPPLIPFCSHSTLSFVLYHSKFSSLFISPYCFGSADLVSQLHLNVNITLIQLKLHFLHTGKQRSQFKQADKGMLLFCAILQMLLFLQMWQQRWVRGKIPFLSCLNQYISNT